MDDVNYYLNDESNNDKQLIKELSIYIKNHRNKKLPIDKKFVNDVTNIILLNSEMDYEGTIFDEKIDAGACWYNTIKKQVHNISGIIKDSKDYKKNYFRSNVGDNSIFAYFVALEYIIHELTHGRQYYICENRQQGPYSFAADIYDSSFSLMQDFYDFYDENHDYFLTERYASLRGYNIAIQTLSYVFPPKKVNFLNKLLIHYLLEGYQIFDNDELVPAIYNITDNNSEMICAFDKFLQLFDEAFIKYYGDKLTEEEMFEQETDYIEFDIEDEDMSLFNRLYLTGEEYDEVKKIYYNLPEEKMNVKKLINKINK